MRKLILITLILLASTTAMGCVICNEVLPSIEGPTYSPTVASVSPTAMPTEIPSISPKYITVETDSPPYQYMSNQVMVSHPRYYRTDDWEMPVPAQGSLKPAHHGVIHELEFWNPTAENKTVSVYSLQSAFYENKDMPHRFITSWGTFYDSKLGFFTDFNLEPNEHRTVLMYSYIDDDSYEKYRGYFVEPVSVAE